MTPSFLAFQDVSLAVAGASRPILAHLSYQVNTGDFIVIVGSNGSGKSSLLKLLDGRYAPTAGSIQLDGRSLAAYSPETLSRCVKTLTQNCYESLFTSLTIFENYALVRHRHAPTLSRFQRRRERSFFSDYLAQFNVHLASQLDRPVEPLSGGEKQALALALTVLHPPRLLLLDEHTSALDPPAAEHIMQLTQAMIQRHGITCLLTTHDLAIAERYGNRLLTLRGGEIHRTIEPGEKHIYDSPRLLATCYT